LAGDEREKAKMRTLTFILFIIVIVSMFFAFKYGIEKAERAECLKWQEEAKNFKGYYLLDYQRAQCEHHNIKL